MQQRGGGPGGSGGDSSQKTDGGHSLSFVLNMLEDLWTKAIEEYLEIERKNFKVSCAYLCKYQ